MFLTGTGLVLACASEVRGRLTTWAKEQPTCCIYISHYIMYRVFNWMLDTI
jgi:hypothetical protein